MRSSRVALALACAGLAACDAIPDESLAGAPVYSLKGHVDVSKLRVTDKPLFVTLVWGAAAQYSGFCLEHGNAVPGLAEACGSPFSFVRRAQSVEGRPLQVDADGTFTWSMRALPDAGLTVGSAAGRVVYGSFVVFDDESGAGLLMPGGGGGGGGGRSRGGPDRSPGPVSTTPTSVFAASFSSLLRPQHRVLLREGAWNVAPLYYPLFGCTGDPPQGFSLVRATLNVTTEGAFSGSCDFEPPSEVVELAPLSEIDGKAFACGGPRVQMLSPEWLGESPPRESAVCLDAETLVDVDDTPYCPMANVVRLKGCWDPDDPCEEPDWDYTAHPPSWWRCP